MSRRVVSGVCRREVSLHTAALCLSAALLAAPSRGQCPQWTSSDPSALRAVALFEGEADPAVARSIAALGANAVASLNPPDAAAGASLAAAGLGYVARIAVRDVERLPVDPDAVRRLRAVPALVGLEYFDDSVTEGYAAPETQQRAYGILRSLFPDLLVLYATRLDPIATDPTYLDDYFRPQFTDLVVPYFYPVGDTILGPEQETDAWEDRLRALLAPVAARTPATQGIFPVLQAFEQAGYPLSGGFLRRQVGIYAELWPANSNAILFAWSAGDSSRGIDESPVLRRATEWLFGAVPSAPRPCLPPARGDR